MPVIIIITRRPSGFPALRMIFRGFVESAIEAVIRVFIVRRQVIQTGENPVFAAPETGNHVGCIRKRHQRYFVLRSEPFERSERRVAHFVAERVKASAAIDQQNNRKRKRVLTELSYLLPDSVFSKHEVVFCQIADYAAGLVLDYLRVEDDEINGQSDVVGALCPTSLRLSVALRRSVVAGSR